ncbi:hypothetical protein Emag_001735 [Eimeria magna]
MTAAAAAARIAVAQRHAALTGPAGAGQPPAAAAGGVSGALSSGSSSSRATPAAPIGGGGGGGTWAASPPPTAPLLGPQRNLLHAKKERICGGSLLPYWSARQIIINPLADDEAVTTSALGGRPRPHMQSWLRADAAAACAAAAAEDVGLLAAYLELLVAAVELLALAYLRPLCVCIRNAIPSFRSSCSPSVALVGSPPGDAPFVLTPAEAQFKRTDCRRLL